MSAARRRSSISRVTRALVGQVEREQRLVAQQHVRVADQGLRHPQPLLLATGQPPDRRVGVRRAADGGERGVHPLAPLPAAAQPEAEAGARRGRGRRGRGRAAAGPGRGPSAAARSRCSGCPRRGAASRDPHLAGGQRQQPEQHPHQRGLAGAVRAEHRDELAGRDVEVETVPQRAVAEAHARRRAGTPPAWRRAASRRPDGGGAARRPWISSRLARAERAGQRVDLAAHPVDVVGQRLRAGSRSSRRRAPPQSAPPARTWSVVGVSVCALRISARTGSPENRASVCWSTAAGGSVSSSMASRELRRGDVGEPGRLRSGSRAPAR